MPLPAPLLALVLSLPWVVGPVDPPLPPSAEVCVLTALLCLEVDPYPAGCDDETATCTCAEAYETCTADEPTLHEPHCRVDLAWCRLEPPDPASPVFAEWSNYCAEAEKTCPTGWEG